MNEQKNNVSTIQRIFDAPLNLVWEAWIKPEHIASWWGPKGMTTDVNEHDFRVGGKWQYNMQMPDGSSFISEGVYTEIIDYKKIVTSANFKPMTEGVTLEIHLEAMGEQTKFTFHVIHPTEAYRLQQEKMGFFNGWGSAFDRLEQFLIVKV